MKTLVLFDFDGTITRKDTLFVFIKYYSGERKYLTGMVILSPILLLRLLKIISSQQAKEVVLTWFFKGEDVDKFDKICADFSSKIDQLVRPKALAELKRYKDNDATLAVVTASADNWVAPWCNKNGIVCLATNLEVVKKKLTGKIDGKNCNGVYKKNKILSYFNLNSFDQIIAYGDTVGDLDMLALAHTRFYKPFRT
ncbi:MAG: HAD family hydrolase [Cyclobacteriaceae bacterium]